MKIALVTRSYIHHGPGGMAHVCHTRYELLKKAGYEVKVFTTPPEEGEPAEEAMALDCPPKKYGDTFTDSLVENLYAFKPDVVHLESFDKHRCEWWEQFPAVIVTLHGDDINASFKEFHLKDRSRSYHFDTDSWAIMAAKLDKAFAVIATCQFDLWCLQDLGGVWNSHHVYNPIPEAFFRLSNIPYNSDGPLLFLALWGAAERGLETAHTVAKYAGKELLVPNCSRDELIHHYDSCSALLLPGYATGLDLCFSEARARGVPVIASPCGTWFFEQSHDPGLHIASGYFWGRYFDLLKGDYTLNRRLGGNQNHPDVYLHEFKKILEPICSLQK